MMASKVFQSGVIRGYFLGSNIHSSDDDEEFYLCFGSDGTMFVCIFFSPNKMYSRGYWSDKVYPAGFDNYNVGGKRLRKLVAKKLKSILAEGSESK